MTWRATKENSIRSQNERLFCECASWVEWRDRVNLILEVQESLYIPYIQSRRIARSPHRARAQPTNLSKLPCSMLTFIEVFFDAVQCIHTRVNTHFFFVLFFSLLKALYNYFASLQFARDASAKCDRKRAQSKSISVPIRLLLEPFLFDAKTVSVFTV